MIVVYECRAKGRQPVFAALPRIDFGIPKKVESVNGLAEILVSHTAVEAHSIAEVDFTVDIIGLRFICRPIVIRRPGEFAQFEANGADMFGHEDLFHGHREQVLIAGQSALVEEGEAAYFRIPLLFIDYQTRLGGNQGIGRSVELH